MKKLLLTFVSCAAFVLSSAAVAQDGPKEFKAVDTNADGMVDAAEFAKSGVKKPLAELDKDKNGSLSKKEYEVVLEEECE